MLCFQSADVGFWLLLVFYGHWKLKCMFWADVLIQGCAWAQPNNTVTSLTQTPLELQYL